MWKQENQYKTVTVHSAGTERRLGGTGWEAAAWDLFHLDTNREGKVIGVECFWVLIK